MILSARGAHAGRPTWWERLSWNQEEHGVFRKELCTSEHRSRKKSLDTQALVK